MRVFIGFFLCAFAVFSANCVKADNIKNAQQQKVVSQEKNISDDKATEATQEQDEFITAEERKKQEIADNNYSLSYFTQNMELSLEQLDEAKKLSQEDKMKRESLLQSIYMLRDQSRELEQESIDKFKKLLNPKQLAVFEELRKEQLKYRSNYDVLDGSVKDRVETDRKIISIDKLQRTGEKRRNEELKKIEQELKKEEDDNIKHGRWNFFD